MKLQFYILAVLFLLISCGPKNSKGDKQTSAAPMLGGEYFKNTSSAEIIVHSTDSIKLYLCFADENCIEPCYKGDLIKISRASYTGSIYDENEGPGSGKHPVKIIFSGNSLTLSFTGNEERQLGMTCDPEGLYKKREQEISSAN